VIFPGKPNNLLPIMAQRGRKSAAALSVIPIKPRANEDNLRRIAPEPPPHLGDPERRLWRLVFTQYVMKTSMAAEVLATGLEAHQRARLAREQVDGEGMTFVGRAGEVRPHPSIATERVNRAAFFKAIKQLGLKL
jgi:hypothetical protein